MPTRAASVKWADVAQTIGGVKNDGGTGGGVGKQDEFMDAIKSMGKKQ